MLSLANEEDSSCIELVCLGHVMYLLDCWLVKVPVASNLSKANNMMSGYYSSFLQKRVSSSIGKSTLVGINLSQRHFH